MSDKAMARTLLAEFGAAIGIDGLTFDEANNCCLVFDGNVVVNIGYEEGARRLLLFAYLGAVPNGGNAGILAELLEANFFWRGGNGATISIEAGSKAFVLMQAVPLAGLSQRDFQAQLEGFVNATEYWMKRLAGGAAAARPKAETAAAPLGMRV